MTTVAISRIPAYPSLMCFFNRGNAEGTNSSNILCLTFVYVFLKKKLCKFVSGTDLCFLAGCYGLMICVESK